LRKLFSEYSSEKWKNWCEPVRKIENKYCEEDGIVNSELNNIIISCPFPVSAITTTVALLQVIRRATMIGEAGGKEGKADSQGKNVRALHFIRRLPITCSL
jgi:hypothetical protein